MLFDLRARGRRRIIQVVYLTLALLMGGGLVLFGIGGDVQGGLVDAFTSGGGNATEQIEERVEDAEKRARANPRDARAYAVLAESRYQLAGQSEGFDETTGAFTGKARSVLLEAEQAWDRHLQLAGDRPNANLARTMQNAFIALDKPDKAVRAQEIALDSTPNPGFGDFARLAQLAYLADQTRKGDLAAERAEELAPEDQREALKASLEQAKTQAAQQAAGAAAGAAGGSSATPTPTPAPAPSGG